MVQPMPRIQHQMPLFQKIPVFQKESQINLKDNNHYSMNELDFDSTNQELDFDKNEISEDQTQEQTHGQESKLKLILSKLKPK
jgi:hypothetical protein